MKNTINRLTVWLFVGFLFAFGLAFWILPDNTFSPQENRALRTSPRFSWERLAAGTYAEDVNDYFADQFPLRDQWVGAKALCSLALGGDGNDGVLLGEGGQLATYLFDIRLRDGTRAQDLDAFDPEHVRASGEAIGRLASRLDVPFSALLVGRTIDVCATAFDYPQKISDALLQQMEASVGTDEIYVDIISPLRQRFDAGEYVYYRTDHHWTTLGAYYAYAEILRAFGMEDHLLPPSAFTRVTVSDAFYGTMWSRGGMKFVPPDTMELWFFGNESTFSVVADGVELLGFYQEDYLKKKDQYSTFLDGTHDVVTITKRDESDRPKLLILKDSFANSVAPFLAQHFDLVLLNLSSAHTDFTNVSARVGEYGADRVLLLYGLENTITAGRLRSLR